MRTLIKGFPKDNQWSNKLDNIFREFGVASQGLGASGVFVKNWAGTNKFNAFMSEFISYMKEHFPEVDIGIEWGKVKTVSYDVMLYGPQKVQVIYSNLDSIPETFIFPNLHGIGYIDVPKVYLAGPDVFRLAAREIGRELVEEAAKAGLQGLYPLDNEVDRYLNRTLRAEAIYKANLKMIRDCDAVIANVNDFRGTDPDSGTSFEIGYAVALGKPVFMYIKDGRSLRQKIAHYEDGFDQNCLHVEDFGLPVNLMLGCSGEFYASAREALAAAKAHLDKNKVEKS